MKKYALISFVIVAYITIESVLFFKGFEEVYRGDAMIPTVQPGSYFVWRPYVRAPNRGDVVVYSAGEYRSIARIVAVPGDEVSVSTSGVVTVERLKGGQSNVELSSAKKIMGPDEYYVVGDNRDRARDSRHIGSVLRESILGKVVKVNGQQLTDGAEVEKQR